MMRFTQGPLFDPEAEKKRADAIEKSEQSRAERELANKEPPARPDDWRAFRRPTDDEVDFEILNKTKKGL